MANNPKLVRDKIPEIIAHEGNVPTVHTASDEEYRSELYKKLNEEVREVTEVPSLEEAADLYEVLLAICTLEGWTLAELEAKRFAKCQERGGFTQRIILESVV